MAKSYFIMRNWVFVICLIFTEFAFAQDTTKQKTLSRTVFKISPFHFVQNTLKVGLENFNKSGTKSISIYAGVRSKSNTTSNANSDDSYNGVLGEVQFKKYVSPIEEYISKRNRVTMVTQGIYGGVFIQGGSYSGSRNYVEYNYDPGTQTPTNVNYKYSENTWNAGIGFVLGAQRVFWNAIFVDVYIGGGLQVAESSLSGQIPPNYYSYNSSIDPGYKGIIPKIGIQIGMGL